MTRNYSLHQSRRSFLKTLGLVSGMLTLPGLGQGVVAAQSPPVPPSARVGFLPPWAHTRSLAAGRFLAGMRLGFDQANGAGIELVTARAGGPAGPTPDEIRRLVEHERVDLLVGMVNPTVAATLGPVLAESRTSLLVADAGANLIRPDERHPYIFANDLGYFRANWAMGEWAASHVGKRAFVAASLFESGYDSLEAFRLGFESAGGQVLATRVTPVNATDLDAPALMAEVRAAEPDLLFGLFSDQEAVSFLQAFAASGLGARVRLLTSPFLLNESLLPTQGEAALGVRSCLSWTPDLPTPENALFREGYTARTGERPDSFAMLGYDTARLIVQALADTGGTGRHDNLRDALRKAKWSSPRGAMRMDPATHTTSGPVYLREVRPVGDRPQNEIVATLLPIDPADQRLAPLLSATRTGWLNPYLIG